MYNLCVDQILVTRLVLLSSPWPCVDCCKVLLCSQLSYQLVLCVLSIVLDAEYSLVNLMSYPLGSYHWVLKVELNKGQTLNFTQVEC